MWWHFDFKFSVCDLFFSLETVRNFFLSQYFSPTPIPPPNNVPCFRSFFLSGLFQIRETYFSLLTHFLILILQYFSLHHMSSISGSPIIDVLDSCTKSLLEKNASFSPYLFFFVLFFQMMSYTSWFRFSTCFFFGLACFFLSCSLVVHFFFILPCSIFSELSLNKKETLCHGFCFDLLYFGSFPHLIFLNCLFIQEWISKKLMEVWVKGLKVSFFSDCVIRWSAVLLLFSFSKL